MTRSADAQKLYSWIRFQTPFGGATSAQLTALLDNDKARVVAAMAELVKEKQPVIEADLVARPVVYVATAAATDKTEDDVADPETTLFSARIVRRKDNGIVELCQCLARVSVSGAFCANQAMARVVFDWKRLTVTCFYKSDDVEPQCVLRLSMSLSLL